MGGEGRDARCAGTARSRACAFASRRAALALALSTSALLWWPSPAPAQTGNNGEPPSAAEPPAAGSVAPPTTSRDPAPSAPTRDGRSQLAPVQITGSRPDDTQERRNSTAAKIVIGRDEIDKFGDSTLGDVLKRLPGVTLQGRPGRGGAIRMRGLGGGYTQILLDGERVPPGFSLDSIPPDQIERIEILRAPTAETGARAIAGTINIVTRGGYTRRVNDVRVGIGFENGHVQPGASWTRNFTSGPLIVNYSLSGFYVNRDNSSTTTTEDRRLDDGTLTLQQVDDGRVRVRGGGVNGNARIQWRAENGRDSATLIPIVYANRYRFRRDGTLVQTIGATPPPYEAAHSEGLNESLFARLSGEWTHRFETGGRTELRAGVGRVRSPSHSFRSEYTAGRLSRTLEDSGHSRDTTITASGKLVREVFDEHSLVAGVEGESNRRADTRICLQDGQPCFVDFGDNVAASARRVAAYAQDEWAVSPNWAAHAGLRFEQITTRGTVEQGDPEATNRSSVWTPLLHAVWKPDPKGRDQLRTSLTRSYKSPTLGSLIARPSINSRYPIPGPNTPTQPDRAGNPELRPELATGVDVAVERYLPGSGLLSANVFHRRIKDYMRSVTTPETVSYSNTPRYVLRPQNVGKATTSGLELEAKFRLSDFVAGAPRVDVRSNASFFRSRVDGVPGPDNRLDQQPRYTANAGADYRFAAVPLLVGGNVNWTPGYTTRLSDEQTAFFGAKLVADAFALWTFGPNVAARLSLSNLAPRDYLIGGSVDGPDIQGVPVRETARTTQPTYLNVQLRLELKL